MFVTAQRNVPGDGRGLDWLTRELILLEGDVCAGDGPDVQAASPLVSRNWLRGT